MKAKQMDNSNLKAELEQLHSFSYGWAVSCCGSDRTEAEDVLQIVYLKILEGKARYRGEASFKTWLFAVIRYTAVDERRKNLLRKLRLVAESRDVVERISPVVAQDQAVERSETEIKFRVALGKLSARQREVLHLVFYQDLSLREAADVMGTSVGSVRRHYDRGKKRLRDLLTQAGNSYGMDWRREKNPGIVS